MRRFGPRLVFPAIACAAGSCALFGDPAERAVYRAAQERLIVIAICGDYEGAANRTYLEVDGKDPDEEFLKALRKKGLMFLRGSEYPGSKSPVDSAFVPEKLSIRGFHWIHRDEVELNIVRGTETRYATERLRVRRNDQGVWRLVSKEGRHFP